MKEIGDGQTIIHGSISLKMPARGLIQPKTVVRDAHHWGRALDARVLAIMIAEIEKQKALERLYWDRWPVLFKNREKAFDRERRYRTPNVVSVVSASNEAVLMPLTEVELSGRYEPFEYDYVDFWPEISAVANMGKSGLKTILPKIAIVSVYLTQEVTLQEARGMAQQKVESMGWSLVRQEKISPFDARISRVRNLSLENNQGIDYSSLWDIEPRLEFKKIYYSIFRYYIYLKIRHWIRRPYSGLGWKLRAWLLNYLSNRLQAGSSGLGNDHSSPEMDYTDSTLAVSAVGVGISNIN